MPFELPEFTPSFFPYNQRNIIHLEKIYSAKYFTVRDNALFRKFKELVNININNNLRILYSAKSFTVCNNTLLRKFPQ